MATEWWSEQCPSRGEGLGHAHWSKCDPQGVHPHDDTGNEGNQHPITMCCHCQMTEEMDREVQAHLQAVAQQTPSGPVPPPVDGKCLFHASFTPKRTEVKGVGIRWVCCPSCGLMVEPKEARGVVTGPLYGPGRGDLTDRQKRRLRDMAERVAKYDAFERWMEEHRAS